MNAQRFTLSGFEMVRQEDTSTHEVEVGKVSVGDESFIVHMIQRKGLDFKANFLIAKIYGADEKKVLWRFPKSFSGLGFLTEAGDEVVVALVGKGRNGKVEEVLSLTSLLNKGPLDLRHVVKIKLLAARSLGRNYNLTKAESLVASRESKQRQEEEDAAKAAAHEARQEARQKRVTQITSRERIHGFTSDGGKRFGFPVTGKDWESLPDGTYVVLVESYNDETGEIGELIEAFQVVKEKGKNPQKGFSTQITLENKAEELTANAPKPVDSIVIESEAAEFFEVMVYATMEDIRAVRAAGLNNGQYVTARDKVTKEKFEIFSVFSNEVKSIGLFAPIE